jgi:L-aminopeptidase/D-esterase-like protein
VIATNADLSKADACRVACMSHTGLCRAINPVHTMSDGDTAFCMATGDLPWERSMLNTIGALAAEVTVQAILNSVKTADSGYGLIAWKDLPAGLKGS